MKKIAAFLSVLSLLAASGCSNAENTPAENTTEETSFTLIVEELPEVTETTETAAEQETESIAETTAESTETASQETEASAPADTSVSTETTEETIAPTENITDLLGTWEYVDGYRLRFMEENAAEMQLDFSGTMIFSEDKLLYNGVQYTPSVSEEIVSVKLDDGTVLLRMTSLDRGDGYHFNGRYRLEDCQLYAQLTEGIPTSERPVYYIDVDGSAFRVVLKAEYHASADGVLELVQNGSTLILHYDIEPGSLKITDETGAQDILTRVE